MARYHVMRSDAELIHRVRDAGDESAFRELYRRHAPRLYRLQLRLAGGRVADAEDALQETWIRAMQGLIAIAEPDRFGSWLRAVAVNVFRERARTDLRRMEILTTAQPFDDRVEPVPSGYGIDLERAILALPTGYRTIDPVLVLRDSWWRHATRVSILGSTCRFFRGSGWPRRGRRSAVWRLDHAH